MRGLRVGVTGARKGDELTDLLERRGATALWGPTLATVEAASDTELAAETDAVIAAEPGWTVASTGAGMRAWAAAADATGRGEALRRCLHRTRAVARGSKAAGGLAVLGLTPEFVAPGETDADLAGWLAPQLGPGDRIALQVHGSDDGSSYGELAEAGATLLRVRPERCVPPEDPAPALRLIDAAVRGELDAVIATSAPAVTYLLAIAADAGRREALVEVLRTRVGMAVVGPVTAAACEEAGVPVAVMPQRARTAELVRAVEAWAARRNGAGLPVGLELCPAARVVRWGEQTVVLGPLEFAVLAALVRRPGVVCPPALLAREAWGHTAPGDPHQVKHQVSRLRRKLGPAAQALQTVRSVGYRYDPGAAGAAGR